jgi:hypothetical protein
MPPDSQAVEFVHPLRRPAHGRGAFVSQAGVGIGQSGGLQSYVRSAIRSFSGLHPQRLAGRRAPVLRTSRQRRRARRTCVAHSATSRCRRARLSIVLQRPRFAWMKIKATQGARMAQTLEALGPMMIGLAKNGAGTSDFALNVDFKGGRDGRIDQR